MPNDEPKPLIPKSAKDVDIESAEKRGYLRGLRAAWNVVAFERERYYTCGGLARATLRAFDRLISGKDPEDPKG